MLNVLVMNGANKMWCKWLHTFTWDHNMSTRSI